MTKKKIILGVGFLLLLAILMLLSSLTANAKTYYFSSVSGDDNRTEIQAQNQATPWKTLSKLSAFWGSSSCVAGDFLLLKRGETFYGTITIGKSGTNISGVVTPITLDAYGTGARPIVTGFTTITFPNNLGGGIYESNTVTDMMGTRLLMVVINGVQYAMGRWPNKAPFKATSNFIAWNSYESYQPSSDKTLVPRTITDNQLTTTPYNWTGGEVVIKRAKYIIDWAVITAHSGGTLTYTYDRRPGPYLPYGYFIQNDARTLDQFGEWYYNKATKKLRMYFGSGGPSSYTVEAASKDYLLLSTSKNYVTVNNITFRGSNVDNISIAGGIGVKITNCDVMFAGYANIQGPGTDGLIVDGCFVTDGNTQGIKATSSSVRTQITNNTVRNTYMIPGMGGVGDGQGFGIRTSGASVVEYNHLKNMGYCGIYYGDNNSKTGYNVIDSFCLVKDDGGGIYSAHTQNNGSNYVTFVGQKIYNNICINGIGNSDGTTSQVGSVWGIYCDDNENNVEIYNNFLAFNGRTGMYLHNNRFDNVHHNTFYNNLRGGIMPVDDGLGITSNDISLNNNYFIQKNSTEIGMLLWHELSNPVGILGTMNNNVYGRPTASNAVQTVKNLYESNQITTNYNLGGWKTYSGKDVNSTEAWVGLGNNGNASPTNIIWFYNDTKANKTFTFACPGTYIDVKNVPYTNSITLGSYETAVLIRTSGAACTSNTSPTVSITAPANGANYTSPASITITATATDADGTISNVAFYQGSTLLNTDVSSPYSFAWTSVPNGNYAITAKATDNSGNVTTSSTVNVTVTSASNVSPTVNITSPANNATYTAPASITINATAADADGTVSSVAFYQGSTLLSTDNSSPYSYNWTSVPAGNYSLTAVATDNLSAITTSSAVAITVSSVGNTAPTVSLTSPTGGATYTSPATITITATANDADGFISRVDFYNGTEFLQSEVTLPYTWDWVGVNPGTYVITAKAYDDDNDVTTSTSRTVTVNAAVVPPTVTITKPANNANYLTGATIPFEAIGTSSNSTIQKIEFYHGGTTLFQTENNAPYEFTRGGWTNGTYVVTAKIYDNAGGTATSSPITFVVASGANILPTVSLTSPTGAYNYNNPATILLSANAADADGSISNVKFYNGATLLHTEVTAPYEFTWTNVPVGVYTITAQATDNVGGVTTSGNVIFTVENALPIDSIISPLQDAFFYSPADIEIQAYATDSINGTITKVDFYEGGILLGTDLTSPYSFTWSGVTAGDYTLSVVATDNDGGTTQSGQIHITVGTQSPASLTITSDLSKVYDGLPKPITVVTNPASLSVVNITYSGSPTAPTNAGIYPLVVSLTNVDFIAESITDTLIITKATPIITWGTPTAITYPTALSGTQLNATANVAGTFSYLPASGTVLNAGTQSLSATFTPTDQTNYNSVVANSVNLVVNKATATITLSNLNQDYDGLPKPITVTTSPVGIETITTTYDGSTTPPTASDSYDVISSLSNTNYQATPATGTLVITASAQAISISNINQIYNGTPRPVTITTEAESWTVTYNASSTVPTNAGTFEVIATITDLGGGADTATLIIAKANPVITWPSPSAITYGTALSGTELDATADVAGSFVFTPASGFIPNAGTQVLSAVFTPTDAANYNTISGITTTLTVNKAVAVLTFDEATLYQLWDGTPKSVIIISTPEVLSGLTVTYQGNPNPPINSGDYTVVVSLSNANYQATTLTGTLSIVPVGVPNEVYNYILLNRTIIVNQNFP